MRWVQSCGSLSILWHCLSLGLEWKLTLSGCGHHWAFQICCHIECITLKALSFRICNSLAGIPSPPLSLFIEFCIFCPTIMHVLSMSLKLCVLKRSILKLPKVIQCFFKLEIWILVIQGSQARPSVNKCQELTTIQPCSSSVSEVNQLTSLSFWPI